MLRAAMIAVLGFAWVQCAPSAEPLASWNDVASKRAIMEFVGNVTTEGSPSFVPASERIAVFDNDGTLWCEKPIYFQVLFALDRVKALSERHPEWKTQEPFASVLKGDRKGALAGGTESLLQLISATHTGMTADEFDKTVGEWIRDARHPESQRLYTDMVYQPMLELLDYLDGQGFKNFIVSGGGIDFIRVWSERVYGIPPHRVVGSSVKTRYKVLDGVPAIVRLPEVGFVDDKAGKPIGIQSHIGLRPILAVGNSDGDFEMLEWTTAGAGPRMGIIIHHTDEEREYAYDRESSVGRLERGLRDGKRLGWTFVDMKLDWKTVFAEPTR